MKYILVTFLILLFIIPSVVFAAVGYDQNSVSNTGGTADTSLADSVTVGASATLMTVTLATRFDCVGGDVSGVSFDWNGATSFTYMIGQADEGDYNGDCVYLRNAYLENPDTGTHTFTASWTSSARAAMIVRTYTGADAPTAVSTSTSAGNFSETVSITSGEMLEGSLGIADQVDNFAMADDNVIEVADSNFVGAGGNTLTGSGSLTINGTASSNNIFGAITISEAPPAPVGEGEEVTLFF